MRELIRSPIELAIRQLLVSKDDRERIGRARRLLRDELVQRPIRIERLLGTVPVHEDRLPFFGRKDRQRRNRPRRIVDGGVEQTLEMRHEPPDSLRVEDVGTVMNEPAQPLAVLPHVDDDVVRGGGVVDVHLPDREVVEAPLLHLVTEEDEHDLGERVVAEIALRLQSVDDLLERHVLMGLGPARRFPHTREQRREAGIAGDIGAQRQHVDQAADQRLRFALRPVRDHGADDEALLPGVARHQRLETGEERHEKRRPVLLRQLPQAGRQTARQAESVVSAAMRLRRWARAVGGHLEQRRQVCELTLPVGELFLVIRRRKGGALPGREVRILNRQRRQRRG